MTRRLILDAEEWRHSLVDGRRFAFEPVDGPYGPRVRMTVYEEDGAGGWEAVMGADFSPNAIAECGDYFMQVAAHLEGKS